MANRRITVQELGAAIAKELETYSESVTKRVNVASEEAAKTLVVKTQATAPKRTGSFRRHIASKLLRKTGLGDETYVWYVKPPDHRITHLLVHGHAGNGHKGHPFLHNALEEVQRDYEKAVEEAVQSD